MNEECAVPTVRRKLFPRPPRCRAIQFGDPACALYMRLPWWVARAGAEPDQVPIAVSVTGVCRQVSRHIRLCEQCTADVVRCTHSSALCVCKSRITRRACAASAKWK